MKFDVISAIHNRSSIKQYHDSFLEETKRDALQRYINAIGFGPFNTKTKFYLADLTEIPLQEIRSFQLPKNIVHAYSYIVGTVLSSEYNLEDYGYIFESIILYATSIQLGTCWIGTKFNRNRFAELIHAKDFEIIPCITPVGLPEDYKEKSYLIASYLEKSNEDRARKKKQQLFFESNFKKPLLFESSSKYLYALEMVRLSPSLKNQQPWRILYDPISKAYHFYLEHSLPEVYLPQCEDLIDLQRVDIGVAMCHFDLTLQQLGVHGKWRIIDPNYPLPSSKIEYIATWSL